VTKKQRILYEVKLAVSKNPLGAARTADLDAIKVKYGLSTSMLKAMCLGVGGAQYWI
jgi:hypothetical protein